MCCRAALHAQNSGSEVGIGNARACPEGAVAHSCCNEHEGRIPHNHRPARKDEESPGTGPMIEGRSDSEKGSWLFKPRVFFQFEFFSLGLWFCSEYFVVPTTAPHRRISHEAAENHKSLWLPPSPPGLERTGKM